MEFACKEEEEAEREASVAEFLEKSGYSWIRNWHEKKTLTQPLAVDKGIQHGEQKVSPSNDASNAKV